MSDSSGPLHQPRRLWPPPAETVEVKKEQTKLTAGVFNAAAVACLVTAFFGSWITAIPDSDLNAGVRALLFVLGGTLHLAARAILRYMSFGE